MNGPAPRTAHRTPTDEATKRRKRTKRTNIAGITHVQECYKGRALTLGAVLLQRRRRPCRHQQVSHVLVLAAVLAVVLACEEGTEANGGDLLLPQQHTHNNRNTRGESYILCVSANFFHSAFPRNSSTCYVTPHTTKQQQQHIQHTLLPLPQQRVCTRGTRPKTCTDTHQEHISTAQRPISCISWRSYWSYYIQTVLSRPYLLRGGNV